MMRNVVTERNTWESLDIQPCLEIHGKGEEEELALRVLLETDIHLFCWVAV